MATSNRGCRTSVMPAGIPPQSSIFSFSMILVSLCFLVGCCVCYMIMVVMNSTEDFYVKWLSRLIPLAGAGCSAGMVLLAVNPVGHLRRDGTWLYPIFVPHMVGAVGMFASGISLMWILAWCYYLLELWRLEDLLLHSVSHCHCRHHFGNSE
ncbi:hypothetical protein MRX96_051758 [Rhipicephalus microplus]